MNENPNIMKKGAEDKAPSGKDLSDMDYTTLLDSLPHAVIKLSKSNYIVYANMAAEHFFSSSSAYLQRHKLNYFIPFGSPVLALAEQARDENGGVYKYRIDISSPRIGANKTVDVFANSIAESDGDVLMVLMPKTRAEKIDRQLTHRSAAQSVTNLASMLAHEIKNPLSGIRGAAQLLEFSAEEADRPLAQLIMEETDRIVKIVNKMEVFSDERPIDRSPVNIHKVLERVRRISENGFARNIPIKENYDPSLPPVWGNFDQLVQVFINLVKNASEALVKTSKPEIRISTAFRPGILFTTPNSRERISLPLEITVSDNGPGIPQELQAFIFDPFITGKINGSGLGLALVAKIIGDHGGIIECDENSSGAHFRILLPTYRSEESGEEV